MADLKISQFADGGSVQGTDEIASVRLGVNTKVKVGSVASLEVGIGSGQVPTADLLAAVALSNDYEVLDNLPTLGALAAKDEIQASDIDSGSATAGQVPVSDGAGLVTWQDQSGSGTVAANAVSATNTNNLNETITEAQKYLDALSMISLGDNRILGISRSGNWNTYLTSCVIDGTPVGWTNAPPATPSSPTRLLGTLTIERATGASLKQTFSNLTTPEEIFVRRTVDNGANWTAWKSTSNTGILYSRRTSGNVVNSPYITNNVEKDTNLNYNTTNGRYTANESGNYYVSMVGEWVAGSGSFIVSKNDTDSVAFCFLDTNIRKGTLQSVVSLESGEFFRIIVESGLTINGVSGSRNSLVVFKLN